MAQNLTGQDLGEVLALFSLEIMSVIYPDSDTACEKLEALAGKFLDANRHLVDGPVKDSVTALAEMLVKIEI